LGQGRLRSPSLGLAGGASAFLAAFFGLVRSIGYL
jgi:hypothetical protein